MAGLTPCQFHGFPLSATAVGWVPGPDSALH